MATPSAVIPSLPLPTGVRRVHGEVYCGPAAVEQCVTHADIEAEKEAAKKSDKPARQGKALQCSNCGKPGHLAEYCRARKKKDKDSSN